MFWEKKEREIKFYIERRRKFPYQKSDKKKNFLCKSGITFATYIQVNYF